MKLLFIENRHKTYFFEPIAQRLKSEGHDVFWIIQNKQFLPSEEFSTHFIEYPKGKLVYEELEHVEKVIHSDRQINHFKKKDRFYFYYYNTKIEELLKLLKPDLVFGESTAFHELLTIENCKKLDIPYLNPSTCRYPVGRFSFYKYDTLEPFSGSGERLKDDEAQKIINQIVNRETAPNYMRSTKISMTSVLRDKIKKTYAYYSGETYNTPNPIVKYKLEGRKKENIAKWDKNALKSIEETSKFKILYPLQMQPEANLDVWGRPYRNQTQLIENLSGVLPKETILYIKPNPKSKYELEEGLINLVESTHNIKTLHHSTKMDDILPLIDLVLTVTGTIAIECILSNKPVATFIKTTNNSAANCVFIENIDLALPRLISIIKTRSFPTLKMEKKIDFINLLNSLSFKGIVSDPLSDVNCISEENINDLFFAFSEVIKCY